MTYTHAKTTQTLGRFQISMESDKMNLQSEREVVTYIGLIHNDLFIIGMYVLAVS